MINNWNILNQLENNWKKPYYELFIDWVEINRELVSLDLENSIGSTEQGLTMDTLTLQLKDLTSLGSKFESDITWLPVILKLGYYNNDLTFDTIKTFSWKVDEVTDNEYVMTLTLYSLYNLRTTYTDNTLHINITPKNLLTIIFNNMGFNFEIFKKDETDENWKIINVISFYKKNLFELLQEIIEFSDWKIRYNYNEDKFIYYTSEYLNDKIDNHTRDFFYSSNYWEWTELLLGNSKINQVSQNIINEIHIERYNYRKKTNNSIHYFETEDIWLLPNEEITLNKTFDNWFIENFSIWEKNWRTNSDGTWDNFNGTSWLTDKIWITVIEETPLNYTIKIKNNHTSTLFIDVELLGTGYFYTIEDLYFSDSISSEKYSRRKKSFSNPFFQNKNYINEFGTQYIENNKNPNTIITFKAFWNPLIELLDKIKIKNNKKKRKTFEWLVDSINTTFDIDNGYTSIFTLKNTTYIESITPILDDISETILNWSFDSNSFIETYDNPEPEDNQFLLTSKLFDEPYEFDKLLTDKEFINWNWWTYDSNSINMNWQLSTVSLIDELNLYTFDKLLTDKEFINWNWWTYDSNSINMNWQLSTKSIF